MSDKILRDHLVQLLWGDNAHVSVEKALNDIDSAIRLKRPALDVHSIWEELEHLRIAQKDIIEYVLNPSWQSPKWPEGYWPSDNQVSEDQWQSSLQDFLNDLDRAVQLVNDGGIDLLSSIPHANKHTYLREILLIADHNAYHAGQIVQVRKLLGVWK